MKSYESRTDLAQNKTPFSVMPLNATIVEVIFKDFGGLGVIYGHCRWGIIRVWRKAMKTNVAFKGITEKYVLHVF